jgi:hypothetical protein
MKTTSVDIYSCWDIFTFRFRPLICPMTLMSSALSFKKRKKGRRKFKLRSQITHEFQDALSPIPPQLSPANSSPILGF